MSDEMIKRLIAEGILYALKTVSNIADGLLIEDITHELDYIQVQEENRGKY